MKRIGKKKFLVTLIILFMGIGFAVLTSNLNIEGIFNFAESSWNVYFDDIVVNPNSIEANKPVIDNNKTTISFSGQLDKPGDYYEFLVDVVNDGTMGAMLDEVIKTGITAVNEDYINFTVNYYDGTSLNRYDLLPAGSRTKIIVKVEYKYDIDTIPTLSNMNFSLSLKYVKSNDNANNLNVDFLSSNSSDFILLNNAMEKSLFNLNIYGNTEPYIRRNLYNYADTNAISNGVVADEDGWITMSYDNITGSSTVYCNYYTNPLNVEENKLYSIVMEVKNVSGTGTIYPSSTFGEDGQFAGERNLNFDQLNNNSIIIYEIMPRESYTGIHSLRTFTAFDSGQSGSITFRLSVLKGTNITEENFVYKPYVTEIVSPSLDYPQEIKSVTGNTELKIMGKNLFNIGNNTTTYHGVEAKCQGGLITLNGTTSENGDLLNSVNNLNIPSIGIFKAGTYTFSLETEGTYNSGSGATAIFLRAVRSQKKELFTKVLISQSNTSYQATFTLNEDTELYFQIYSNRKDIIFNNYKMYIKIESGTDATEWEAHKQKVYPISLGNIELNQIEDSRDYIYKFNDKWYIHKEVGKVVLDGTNNKFTYKTSNDGNVYQAPVSNLKKNSTNDEVNIMYCDKFPTIIYNNLNTSSLGITQSINYENNVIIQFGANSSLTTLEQANNYIQSNHITIYYQLENSKEIEITNITLINQLNSILADSLYDGINIVFYNSSIGTEIGFNYLINNN